MPPQVQWIELIAPLSRSSLLIQALALVLVAALVARYARDARTVAASSLGIYALGLLTLVLGNFGLAMGWLDSAATPRHIGVLLLGIAGIRLAGVCLFRTILPLLRFTPPSILEDLLVFAGYLIWALVRLSLIGVDLTSIVTTSAVLTAILAFSLQDTLGNILGGTVLQLDNSLHVGDWVQVGDTVGRVVDIRWRSTLIETRNWETVVMPNATLMKNPFSILGRRTEEPVQLRRWIWFKVAYDIKPQRVISVVEQAMNRARITHVAGHPPPNCVLMGVDDSIATYALRYWLNDLAVDDPTDSAVRLRIYAAFQRAGIAFAFPEQTLHLVKESESVREKRRKKDLGKRENVLAQSELFACLNPEECRNLARHLVYAPFVAGETITAQGDTAHWLYLLISGEADIVLRSEHGHSRNVGRIGAGRSSSFFGEMGLLTGAARSASVIAHTDVECYRLDKPGFEQLLRERPGIAEEISGIMAQRKADLAVAHEGISQEDRERAIKANQTALLRGIRHFFRLD